jgi:hypothetical protein
MLVCAQVGDYVLSPDIVVERKALPDLFASLGSGRLYNQVRHLGYTRSSACTSTPLHHALLANVYCCMAARAPAAVCISAHA